MCYECIWMVSNDVFSRFINIGTCVWERHVVNMHDFRTVHRCLHLILMMFPITRYTTDKNHLKSCCLFMLKHVKKNLHQNTWMKIRHDYKQITDHSFTKFPRIMRTRTKTYPWVKSIWPASASPGIESRTWSTPKCAVTPTTITSIRLCWPYMSITCRRLD